MIPEWLEPNLQSVMKQYTSQSLPHGLLVVGKTGNGSTLFMTSLINNLLCLKNGDSACGVCKSCLLTQANSHPDLLKVEPEGKSQTIKVDAIRAINHKVSSTAQQSGNKVVYLQAAHTMNVNAANALLKVLEEPTDNTYILLESSELSRTLPTIRSRCRIVALSEPSIEQSIAYVQEFAPNIDPHTALGLTSSRPLDAVLINDDAIAKWQLIESKFLTNQGFIDLSGFIFKENIADVLQQLLLWVDSSVRERQNIELGLAPVSPALLQSLSTKTPVSLFQFRDYIVKKLSALGRQSNLNSQLMAEEIASHWLSLRGM